MTKIMDLSHEITSLQNKNKAAYNIRSSCDPHKVGSIVGWESDPFFFFFTSNYISLNFGMIKLTNLFISCVSINRESVRNKNDGMRIMGTIPIPCILIP